MKKNKRFEIVYDENDQDSLTFFKILVDKKTGINYLICYSKFGFGITPLLDENGKNVIEKNKKN